MWPGSKIVELGLARGSLSCPMRALLPSTPMYRGVLRVLGGALGKPHACQRSTLPNYALKCFPDRSFGGAKATPACCLLGSERMLQQNYAQSRGEIVERNKGVIHLVLGYVMPDDECVI